MKYLSPSRINTFLRCPMQYKFRYEDGLVLPPTSALTKGKTVHAGIAYNYYQKRESGKDLPLLEVADYTASIFEEEEENTDWGWDDPKSAKDEVITLTSLYHKEVAPQVFPVLVEEKVEVEFENLPYKLLGYIDLVDADGLIRDTKTAGRSPSPFEVENSIQLTAYVLGYRALTGKTESGVALDYLIKTKSPKLAHYKATRNEAQINFFLDLMEKVGRLIEMQIFYPNPNNFTCNPKFCGYWNMCQGGCSQWQ